jgi:poly(A) polymerase Pap1
MLTLVKPSGIPMQKTARVAAWRCFQGSVFQYFHGVSWGISIRVEICGKEWNQNCSRRSIYEFFVCFDHWLPFLAVSNKIVDGVTFIGRAAVLIQ